MDKFCVDCTYRSKLLGSDMCNRTTGTLDLTTGKHKVLYNLCSLERREHFKFTSGEKCGIEGRFFQQNTKVKYRFNLWFKGVVSCVKQGLLEFFDKLMKK